MNREFVSFAATGGVAALVNLAMRYILNLLVPFEYAVVLAYIAGMFTAYVLSRRYVFAASGRSVGAEAGRFTIVNLFSLAIVWVVSVGLARGLFPALGFAWHADDIAHLIGVMAPVFTSYLGHRYFTFARSDG